MKLVQKKRAPLDAHIFLDFIKGNYLPSWTLNLGVVPLFLLVAFLFAPDFFFLLSLLVVVTLVLETMINLLTQFLSTSINSKQRFLPIQMLFVKILLIFNALTSPTYASQQILSHENIILSIGEHYELTIPTLEKYSLGNPDIISKKFNESNNTLLIKGQKIGFTELIIWKKNKEKIKYQVYVLSRQNHLKILHLAQTLNALGLSTEPAGPLIITEGEIDNLQNYQLLLKIYNENEKYIHLKVSLSSSLKKKILEEIYRQLLDEYIDEIICSPDALIINCRYSSSNPPSEELISKLKKSYLVSFAKTNTLNKKRNLKIKLKIVQIEKLNGEELNLGLSNLSTSLNELFSENIKGIVGKNSFILKNENIDISTLAEPESVIQLDSPVSLQIGAEIPFQEVQSEKLSTTKWKFAGLKVELKLIPIGRDLKLIFTTEVTRGDQDQGFIQGSKESSSATVSLEKPIELFQIGFKTTGLKSNRLPYASKIPIIGNLFYSKSNQENFKKIYGIAVLEEIKDEY